MQQTQMKVEIRTGTGKGISRRLRNAGLIPGVVYGRGMEPVPITIEPKALASAIAGEGGMNNLITLQCSGDLDQSVVIIADMQRDPLTGTIEHVDLHRVNMAERYGLTCRLPLKARLSVSRRVVCWIFHTTPCIWSVSLLRYRSILWWISNSLRSASRSMWAISIFQLV